MMQVLLFMSLFASLNTESWIQSKNTKQSSSYTDGHISYTSDRAVDGILTKCADTDSKPGSWWNIDLLSVYEISNITIYNINQANINMEGCQILIGNTSESNGMANSICTTINKFNLGENNTFRCDNGSMVGQYVTIYSHASIVILCEVWIFSTNNGLVLVKENKTWEDALMHCRDMGMNLAFIGDNQTQVWAIDEAKESNSPFVWLGLRYSCILGFWFWVNDHNLDYNRWASEVQTEECDRSAAMNINGDNQWYSKPDNESFNFLCSK